MDVVIADAAQPPSEKDVRALLAERNYRSDLSIGQLPFVVQIWSRVREPRAADETQRGRIVRAAVWDLIKQHHEEALEGAEPCSVCAPAEADDWHVLWLENTFTLKEGFERRYTHHEMIALGNYAASNGDVQQLSPQEAAIIRRLEQESRWNPDEGYPIRKVAD